MDCSTPGFPALHLPELAQTHVHWVGDAMQPSHPLSSPSPPAFSLSQHQGLLWWISSSHQVAKVLTLQLQHQSFQWIFKVNFLPDWLVWSCCSRDFQESSPAPVWKHQFFGTQTHLWSSYHINTWLQEIPYLWLYGPLLAKLCLCFLICCLGLSEQISLNFLAVVTVCSDFGD